MEPLDLPLPWIIEARKHIGLKEIPGPKHNLTILSWLSQLKAWWKDDETPWCFTAETEILTEDGWVRFDNLTETQKVYQADEDGNLSITPVIKRIEKDYIGDVFDIKHRNINLTCDVGHRWWGYFSRSNYVQKRFGTLDELNSDGIRITSVRSTAKGCGLTLNELWLLAAFLSDGKLRYSDAKENIDKKIPLSIEFEVSRERKIKQLHALKPDHFYVQQKAYGPLTKTPLSVFRFKYPDYFHNCLDGYKSLSKQFINSLSVEDAKTFLQAYSTFDGNGEFFNNVKLYTSDQKILNDLITIVTLSGSHPCVNIRRDDNKMFNRKPSYTIVFSENVQHRRIFKDSVIRRHFKGKLYCVQVPQGRIVVKGPDSSPILTGNCGVFTAHCFRVSGMQLPKHWMRAKDWGNGWGTRLEKPVPGCVVVFERQGGGHVGFVLGITKLNELVVLGGNQSNSVNIARFSRDRVFGYYWPRDFPLVQESPLPVLTVSGNLSTNEA